MVYNALSFRQLEATFLWYPAGNTAALSQLKNLFPAELKIGFSQESGDFYSVFAAKSNRSYEIGSRSYGRLGRTTFSGSMNYSRSYEKTPGYFDSNDPAVNYPYLLADTLSDEVWSKEFFSLKGGISAPLSTNVDWGVDIDYKVGESSQDKDPRPDNKVVTLSVSPGLLYKAGNMRLGADFMFGYYNEDIDIMVVQENSFVSFFQLCGLGNFDYHVSDSYFRLYQKYQAGGGLQFFLTSGNLSNLLYANFGSTMQSVDDGRKGGTAVWSAVKNNARLDGTNWRIADIVSVVDKYHTHLFSAEFQMSTNRGTEFIQRLEKVNETDLERWVTYAKEQKYFSEQSFSEIKYRLMDTDASGNMKSLFSAGIRRLAFSEEYHLPDQSQRYSNIQVQTSLLKLFGVLKNSVSLEVNLQYQFNAQKTQNLPVDNFVVRRIYKPELDYLTKSYVAPGISVGWQIPLESRFDKYFVKADIDWLRAKGGQKRTTFGLCMGLIF